MNAVNEQPASGVAFSERDPLRWARIVNEMVCNVDIVAGGAGQFFGQIRARQFGALELLTITSDRESARRDRRHILTDPDETALLMFVQCGELRIVQRGRELIVGPNTAVFYDLTLPYTYHHSDRTRLLAAKVPITALKARLGQPMQYLGRTYCGSSAPVSIASKYCSALIDGAGGMPPSAVIEYASKSFDLIALMLESSRTIGAVSQTEASSMLFNRAIAVIDAEMANSALDPAAIARKVGISERYLHRIFQAARTTVAGELRERRLRQAYADLKSPAKAMLPISEIGARAGFGSLSHFSRSFRLRFGHAPSAMRRNRPPAVDGGPP